jgi:hypothetical protein
MPDVSTDFEPVDWLRWRNIRHMDATMVFILGGVLLFVIIFGPLFGADSRPAWWNVERKPRFRMSGSMRSEDWPPSEFKR